MKTKWLVAIVFACIGLNSNAQLKGFSIGPYAEMAWPTGDFSTTNKNGIGAGLNADIRLGKLGLTGSAGFMHFAGKTVGTNEAPVTMPAINAIPVRAGIKYHIAPLIYTKLEAGVAHYIDGSSSNSSAFILSPGIGVRFLGLELQAKYETWRGDANHNFWGLKAGYNF